MKESLVSDHAYEMPEMQSEPVDLFRLLDNENGFFLKRVSVSRYERKPPRILPRPPSTSSNQVDLTTFYNASLRHYMPGGIFEAATNVLPQIRQNTGVDFDARGYLGLHRRGEESDGGRSPESVTGIPIGRRLTRLHFLQSASYGEREGTQIGSYTRSSPHLLAITAE